MKEKSRFSSFGIILTLVLSIFCWNLYASADEPVTLDNTVILTEGNIKIPGIFALENGHICSRNGDINVGNAKTVKLVGDDPTWAVITANTDNEITCGNKATIGLARGNVNFKNGCKVLEQDSPVPCPENPPFPDFEVSNSPHDDITCIQEGTNIYPKGHPLYPPNGYGELTVEKNGKCNFQGPGEYNFMRIRTGRSRYQLNFLDDSPICDPTNSFILNVRDFVSFGENGLINSNKMESVDIASVFLNIKGEDDDYRKQNNCQKGLEKKNSVFCFKGDGKLNLCRIFAPNGTITIRGVIRTETQYISKHFQTITGLNVLAGLPDEECCQDTLPPPSDEPSIKLEKLVNNDDANSCPGLQVSPATDLTYTYKVINTGNTVLINAKVIDDKLGNIGTITRLEPGESITLSRTKNAPASGEIENKGTVTATPADDSGNSLGLPDVSDTDTACVKVVKTPEPSVKLKKLVNGHDANYCPGLEVSPSTELLYEYVVTNTGNSVLIDVIVTDDKLGNIGTISRLEPGESITLSRTKDAPASGEIENKGTVTATPADDTGISLGLPDVSDTDTACVNVVTSPEPSVKLVKLVNNYDANSCPGLQVSPATDLTYTYKVTNTGNTVLINAKVTDDVLFDIGTISRLDPGESIILSRTTNYTAPGEIENTGTVTATPADDTGNSLGLDDVSDTDTACVTVVTSPAPSVKLKKLVNGEDANYCPGLEVSPATDLTYTYKVTNTGNTVLINAIVDDDVFGNIGTISRLEPGESKTLSQTAIAPASGFIKNTAKVTATPADDTGNSLALPDVSDTDPACITVITIPEPICGISVEKTADPDKICLPPLPFCDKKEKITQLTFKYTGGGCEKSDNSQKKAVCYGHIDDTQKVSFILQKGYIVDPQEVNPGEEFTITYKKGKFKSNLVITLIDPDHKKETNKIHTSCSQPLQVRDVFGSLTLVAINGQRESSSEVTYTYGLTNQGSQIDNIQVNDDKLGIISSGFSMATGETLTFEKTVDLTESTKNTVYVSGELSNNSQCIDKDSVIVAVKHDNCDGDDDDSSDDDDSGSKDDDDSGSKDDDDSDSKDDDDSDSKDDDDSGSKDDDDSGSKDDDDDDK